jgi:CDP-paratose 2-epimerase
MTSTFVGVHTIQDIPTIEPIIPGTPIEFPQINRQRPQGHKRGCSLQVEQILVVLDLGRDNRIQSVIFSGTSLVGQLTRSDLTGAGKLKNAFATINNTMIAVVTGSHGLIGSEASKFFANKGFTIVGFDNNMRAYFFGKEASTERNFQRLNVELGSAYVHHNVDIRDYSAIERIFGQHRNDIKLVIHAAAQPSHDWAAREPFTDFGVNATGTLNLLEATRKHCAEAVFIFTSTNKVYGDTPNNLPLVEHDERWEIDSSHPHARHGIPESMSIDQSKHSIFGVSKVAADVMVQEYGQYFGMKTGVFRGGCLTGPAHSGAELHGFLSYLVLCAVQKKPYTIFGYKGKQVRDNIHSKDLISAFWHFYRHPRGGQVYNMGGSRHSNVSVLEAIRMITELSGSQIEYTISDNARIGDHIWYISDVRKFQTHYPDWKHEYDIPMILGEMIQAAGGSLQQEYDYRTTRGRAGKSDVSVRSGPHAGPEE